MICYVTRLGFLALSLIAAIVLSGCSGGGLGTAPVTGKVTYADGSPVQGGTIIFADASANLSSVGTIKEDGTYELGTYAENDGAVPGSYKVTVLGTSEYGEAAPVQAKFSETSTTPLEATIVEGKNSIDFQVERGN